MSEQQKRISILGAGESGVGAALLAKAKGFDVFVSDISIVKEKYEQELNANHIDYEEGKHTEELILSASEIVKSPGIPNNATILKKATEQKIPIISEIEFASRYVGDAKIVAITGSNGKTTTTLLTYHLLKEVGLKVEMAGNIGQSFARALTEQAPDYWVLEVSSFQLDHVKGFKPNLAVLLNVTPDHLDRYENNFQNYLDAKLKITQNLSADDTLIFFSDNPSIVRKLEQVKNTFHLAPISVERILENGAYLKGEDLIFKLKKQNKTFTFHKESIKLKGKHNLINVMAVILACVNLGLDTDALSDYFQTFKGVEHRLEEVAVIDDITFINDSKATNVESVFYALDSFEQPIVWIAGGEDKGNDYNKIKDLIEKKVEYIVALGEDNEKLVDTFKDSVKVIYDTTRMRDAVEQAYEFARKGDIVLLSPACASFDLFENYEDRGKQFKKIVGRINKMNNLKKGKVSRSKLNK